jgi:hypothetical protein
LDKLVETLKSCEDIFDPPEIFNKNQQHIDYMKKIISLSNSDIDLEDVLEIHLYILGKTGANSFV